MQLKHLKAPLINSEPKSVCVGGRMEGGEGGEVMQKNSPVVFHE